MSFWENRYYKNWKTTLTGVGLILTGLGDLATQATHLNWDSQLMFTDIAAIMTGIGFIFARDG